MDKTLEGRRVLVVEDEYFIANDVAEALSQRGAKVVGPVADMRSALEALCAGEIDAAVIDLNLAGELDFRIADELSRRNLPFVFATGYDAGAIPVRFKHIGRLEKPYDVDAVLDRLDASLLGLSSARQ